MKTAGGTLYKHVKYGFLIGLVKADLATYDGCLYLQFPKTWYGPPGIITVQKNEYVVTYDDGVLSHGFCDFMGRCESTLS